MQDIVLSLGSNTGERELFLSEAVSMISEEVGEVVRKSAIYETASWGFTSSSFLNQVIVIRSDILPFQLLAKTQKIEKMLGRNAKTKTENGKRVYSDRTIDIDILLYGDTVMNTPTLTIPHPLMHDREFILQPLRELNIDI